MKICNLDAPKIFFCKRAFNLHSILHFYKINFGKVFVVNNIYYKFPKQIVLNKYNIIRRYPLFFRVPQVGNRYNIPIIADSYSIYYL